MFINRYPDHWHSDLDAQIETLRAQFPQAHIYALIEGVLNDTCIAFLQRSKRLPYYALYADTPGADEETLAVSPLLVEHRPDSRRAWHELMRKTDGRPALSVIVTPEALTDVARRLLPWCVVNANDYAVALAFADTRIQPVLFQTLTSRQLGQLCGPALHWQCVTRTAAWTALPLPETGLPPADEVTLDEHQYTHLLDAAEADHVLFQLRNTASNLVDCHTPARAYELTRHWLACADHAQLNDAPARAAICEWGLRHPGLEAHAHVARWLERPSVPQSLDTMVQQWQTGHAL